jgi:hypothetical protein
MEIKEKLQSGCRKIGKIGCIIICAILAISVIITIFSLVKTGCQHSAAAAPFKSHVNEYISITGLKTASPSERPYLRGKVITVDITDNKIDYLYLDLPESLVPKTPEEVSTVIWLKWKKVSVGHYTDGATGYRIDGEVTIIDMTNLVKFDAKTLHGSDPPSTKSGSGDREGFKPTDEIVDYLKSLPRK